MNGLRLGDEPDQATAGCEVGKFRSELFAGQVKQPSTQRSDEVDQGRPGREEGRVRSELFAVVSGSLPHRAAMNKITTIG